MTSTSHHLFWITSRAAGTTALLTASLAVAAGLLVGTRVVRGPRGLDLRAAHEVLALATLGALLVHAGSLLLDSFLRPSLLDLTIPFVTGYHRWWTAAGIFAGWGLVLLGLSTYARTRIGVARWRRLHRFTALAWVLGIAHSLGEGTDSGTTWFLVLTGVVVLPVIALLAVRLSGGLTPSPPTRPVPSRAVGA